MRVAPLRFFLFGLVMTLVTQYFLYRGSTSLRSMCIEVSPLSEADTGRVLHVLHGATVSAISAVSNDLTVIRMASNEPSSCSASVVVCVLRVK